LTNVARIWILGHGPAEFMQDDKECDLDDWLTVHRSITLINLQLDAQILIYLYTMHCIVYK